MKSEDKKILIVEDEKPMESALKLKLEHAGFETKCVEDGEQAINFLGKETFSLILLDLILPKIDGFEILQILKNKKIKTPVIVLTNLSQQDDEDRAKKLGAKEFYVKSNTPIAKIVERISFFLKRESDL